MSKNKTTKTLVQCALFLAIGLVLRNFSYMVFMGGGAGMRIGISGFFTKIPALLFGPGYGAAVSGLIDLFGYVLKPDGPYIFPITIAAALGGALTGLIFKWTKKHSVVTIKRLYICVVLLIGLVGAFNHIMLLKYPDSVWGALLVGFGSKTVYFTYGLYITCALGAIFYVINHVLEKRSKASFMKGYMRVFVTLLIADVTVTTINTFVLIWFIPALAKLPFLSFYLPRLAQEIVSVFINSYVISYLYELCQKTNKTV